MTPTLGLSGAIDGHSFGAFSEVSVGSPTARFSNSKIGFWGPVRSASCPSSTVHSRFTTSMLFSMTAKGLKGRSLSSRSRATAASFVASQQRWNPPMPLIATMPPSRMTLLVLNSASLRESVSALRSGAQTAGSTVPSYARYSSGPQSLQQTGCAWYRRVFGLVYSASQSGHIGNSAMEVRTRS